MKIVKEISMVDLKTPVHKPLKRVLDFHYNYQDAEKAFLRLEEIEKILNIKLDWNRIRHANGDVMATILDIMERKVQKEGK